MTNSTDKKNIGKIVKAILQGNDIDNLKAEIDLIEVWWRYVTEREEGLSPAEVREGITKEFNEAGYSERGQQINITRQEFMDIMKIEVGDSTDWNSLIDFLVKAKAKGETIQKFADWCKADPFNSPKVHQIAQKPLLVKTVWASAFVKQDNNKQSLEDSGWK